MTFLHGIREKLSSVVKDMVSDEELSNNRIEVCNSCEFLLITRNCSKCGCFVDAKTKLLRAGCPLGKW